MVRTCPQKSAQFQHWLLSSFSIDFIKSIGETAARLEY